MTKAKSSLAKAGAVRIISGSCRGRTLRFPAEEGLRPTPDRVRETLFNWLMYEVTGRHCLDLFAGSGALGFEAASRGAASTTLVERSRRSSQRLRENAALLGPALAGEISVQHCDALDWLRQRAGTTAVQFDLVFLDPPFRQSLLGSCSELLENGGLLTSKALIYLEREREGDPPRLPCNWQQIREKQSGQVSYALFQRQPQLKENGESEP